LTHPVYTLEPPREQQYRGTFVKRPAVDVVCFLAFKQTSTIIYLVVL